MSNYAVTSRTCCSKKASRNLVSGRHETKVLTLSYPRCKGTRPEWIGIDRILELEVYGQLLRLYNKRKSGQLEGGYGSTDETLQ